MDLPLKFLLMFTYHGFKVLVYCVGWTDTQTLMYMSAVQVKSMCELLTLT